ncbi:MAG TPA: hydroxyacid dehydrogenase, partial [Candidatus Acidoferrum sp.]|nr:hydroxyacid dehydrogenase [Candidatus Acidoferrum sp.]
MKPRVLVTESIHQVGWDLLAGETEAKAWAGPGTEPLAKALEGVQAVMVRVAKFPADAIRGAKALKIIAKHGVGYDNIDVKTATQCGILVTNTPAANSQSVAEHALTLLLAVARRVGDFSRDMALKHLRPQKEYQGIELTGKVLGVIGLGGAGLRLARMTGSGLGMQVIGYDPYKDPWPEGIEHLRSLDELLARADFISIHVPLTPETRNLINASALAKMKRNAILVNTSRGGIVEETALGKAVRDGIIGGMGLDVVEDEPVKADHPLTGLPT